MVITDFLEQNARLYGSEVSLVELNPSEERDAAVTWRDFSLIESANPGTPYRREMTWRQFDKNANRFANLLLSRGVRRGTKVGILLMNCLEWLPIYFGILKAGCVAVPLNFRYSGEEIRYCLDLADVEILVFGPEFISRLEPIAGDLAGVRMRFFELPHLSQPVGVEQHIRQTLGIDVHATFDLRLCQFIGAATCGVDDSATFCGQATDKLVKRQQALRTKHRLRWRLDRQVGTRRRLVTRFRLTACTG